MQVSCKNVLHYFLAALDQFQFWAFVCGGFCTSLHKCINVFSWSNAALGGSSYRTLRLVYIREEKLVWSSLNGYKYQVLYLSSIMPQKWSRHNLSSFLLPLVNVSQLFWVLLQKQICKLQMCQQLPAFWICTTLMNTMLAIASRTFVLNHFQLAGKEERDTPLRPSTPAAPIFTRQDLHNNKEL